MLSVLSDLGYINLAPSIPPMHCSIYVFNSRSMFVLKIRELFVAKLFALVQPDASRVTLVHPCCDAQEPHLVGN